MVTMSQEAQATLSQPQKFRDTTCFEQLGADKAALPGFQQLQALPIVHSSQVSLCGLLQCLGWSELHPVAHGLCMPGGRGWGGHG